MVIRILDIVGHCNTSTEGEVVFDVISPLISEGRSLKVSFEGVTNVPSSFVNAAFVKLLKLYSADFVRDRLSFINVNQQIADMISRCMTNGLQALKRG